MMPPPQNILRQGTREFEDAVTSGEIELSLPHQDSLSWMNNNRESTSSFSLGSSSNKKRNYHMTREDGMKENLCDTNNVAGEDCNPHHEEEASCSAGQHQDKNNNNHDQNEFSDASVATGGNAKGDDKDPPTEFSRAKTSKGQVSIRFSDIVGHGAVKLRLDEVLLPMALPPALADSILTGK